MNRGRSAGRVGGRQQRHTRQAGGPNKRPWAPENKFFQGSLSEGQGFAFQLKNKVQHEYNKLLTKERRNKNRPKANTPRYTEKEEEEFPEHLRHLYVAESTRLKEEELANRAKRSLARLGGQVKKAEPEDDAEGNQAAPSTEPAAASVVTVVVTDQAEDTQVDPEASVAQVDPEASVAQETETEREDSSAPAKPSASVPMSNRMKRKLTRKTTYQIAQEEFQEAKEKRRKTNEEFLRNKKKKEEAIQKYKNKKKETFQILSKKTKKGQPNLNLQMEYLLQKIQGPRK
ncbi:hypothetical protein CRUP_027725 [Coryphaenoides rupestris]|nr:hypothetical protein CRUP_027725 [Coryphaenoides rupestris]